MRDNSAGVSVQAGRFNGGINSYGGEHLDLRGAVQPRLEFHDRGAVPTALRGLPASSHALVGRDREVRELLDAIRPRPHLSDTHSTTVSAVVGMGGAGKTAIVLEAGSRALASSWFHGVFFVDFRGYDADPVTAGQALEALLRAMGISPRSLPADLAGRSRLYWSTTSDLERQTGAPVLVIADNVSSFEQVEPLMAGSSGSRLLVTSRDRFALPARRFDLGMLSPEASFELLERALHQVDVHDDRIQRERHAALDVVSVCGGLPLALHICAGLLSCAPDQSITELAAALATPDGRLLHLDDGKTSLQQLFDTALSRLSPLQLRLFTLIGLVRCDGLSTEAVASLAQADVQKTLMTLRKLASAHLLSWQSMSRRWIMHDLLSDYAHHRAKEDPDTVGTQRAALIRLTDHYITYARHARETAMSASSAREEGPFSHRDEAVDWLEHERTSITSVTRSALEVGLHETVTELAALTAWYLDRFRYFHSLKHMSELAEQAARSLGDLQREGRSRDFHGAALVGLRDLPGAVESHRHALDLFTRAKDHTGEALACTHLGSALSDLDDHVSATEFHRRSLSSFEQIGDRHGQALAMNNLGLAYHRQQRLTLAARYYTGAHELLRECGDRIGEATTLDNLGVVLQQRRELSRSLHSHTSARDLYYEFDDVHGQGSAWVNIGSVVFTMERYTEAVDAWHRARRLYQSAGDLHGEARTWNNIAFGNTMLKKYQAALDAHTQAHHLYRSVKDRHGEALAWLNLGHTQQCGQRWHEAARSFAQARELFQELNAPLHTAMAWTHLGIVAKALGSLPEGLFSSRRTHSPMESDSPSYSF